MKPSLLFITVILVLAAVPIAAGQGERQPGPGPAPPSNLQAEDYPYDNGRKVILTWDLSPDDTADAQDAVDADDTEAVANPVESYVIFQTLASIDGVTVDPDYKLCGAATPGTTEFVVENVAPAMTLGEIRGNMSDRVDMAKLDALDKHEFEVSYSFQVLAIDNQARRSARATLATPIHPTMQLFDKSRFWLMVISFIFCGAVVYWINHARAGKPIKVRKIAGLEAVDEAVGRATEMGRSCLFVPGILDINDIQTIASMTVLSRVAKTAAEYDAKVEVPTSKSLVMTTARETVQAAFLTAGRPDAYNEDLIYYVTDEQFGYVAYLQGIMVREKPAACFYMGAFFAESLILAETGNSIGAIQIAGTAMPAQLPFFVAACDYTLIGEEFFAASAYLSGSPEEMGSLKGQDLGKVIVFFLLIIGVAAASLAAMTGSTVLNNVVVYLRDTVLT